MSLTNHNEPENCDKNNKIWTHFDINAMRQKYNQFSEEVDVPGFFEIGTAKHWILKVIWAILLLTFFALTIYFIVSVAMDYMDEPILTKVSVTKKDQYEFPPIYICLKDWKSDERLLNMNLSQNGLYYLKSLFDWTSISRNDTKFTKGQADFNKFFAERKYSRMVDPLYYWAWPPEQLNIDSVANVTKELIYAFQLLKVCFNITVSPTTIAFGPKRSLDETIVITAPIVSDEPNDVLVADDLRAIGSGGLATVSRGNSYEIAISSTQFINVPTKDKPCKDNDEADKDDYSEQYCEAICHNKPRALKYSDYITDTDRLFDNEKATWYYSRNWISMRSDDGETNKTEILQNSKFISTFSQLNINDDDDDRRATSKACDEMCPTVCSYFSYDIQWKTVGEKDKTTNATSLTFRLLDAKNGILTYKETLAYSFVSAVSNIGGQLGLWLGCSVITLFQIILFWCKDCNIQERRASRRKVRRMENEHKM